MFQYFCCSFLFCPSCYNSRPCWSARGQKSNKTCRQGFNNHLHFGSHNLYQCNQFRYISLFIFFSISLFRFVCVCVLRVWCSISMVNCRRSGHNDYGWEAGEQWVHGVRWSLLSVLDFHGVFQQIKYKYLRYISSSPFCSIYFFSSHFHENYALITLNWCQFHSTNCIYEGPRPIMFLPFHSMFILHRILAYELCKKWVCAIIRWDVNAVHLFHVHTITNKKKCSRILLTIFACKSIHFSPFWSYFL